MKDRKLFSTSELSIELSSVSLIDVYTDVRSSQLAKSSCSQLIEWCRRCSVHDAIWCRLNASLQSGRRSNRTRSSVSRRRRLFLTHLRNRGFVGFLQRMGSVAVSSGSAHGAVVGVLASTADCSQKPKPGFFAGVRIAGIQQSIDCLVGVEIILIRMWTNLVLFRCCFTYADYYCCVNFASDTLCHTAST